MEINGPTIDHRIDDTTIKPVGSILVPLPAHRVDITLSDGRRVVVKGHGFYAHYHAARAGDRLETVKHKTVKAVTLDQLCDKYLEALDDKVYPDYHIRSH